MESKFQNDSGFQDIRAEELARTPNDGETPGI